MTTTRAVPDLSVLAGLAWRANYASVLETAAGRGFLVERTVQVPLEVWAQDPLLPDLDRYQATMLELLGSGVALGDLLLYVRATQDGPGRGPDATARLLAADLVCMEMTYPRLGLPDAVRWAALAASLGLPVLGVVDEWAGPYELPPQGTWVYACAGLTLVEVFPHVWDQTDGTGVVVGPVITVEAARVMAALRGWDHC